MLWDGGIIGIGHILSRDIDIQAICTCVIIIGDSLTSILISARIVKIINILTCIAHITHIAGSYIVHLVDKS